MNGHDDKNTDENSGSAPQGIFSTPELTVDTEKITPPNSSDNKARIASFFADTDATKQAQQIQDAMTVPTNYATEDLVINNGGKRKRSFLPIIIAVVAVLAVVGGIIAYFLVLSATNGSDSTESAGTSPKEAFNSYVNFLLYNKDETTDITLTANEMQELNIESFSSKLNNLSDRDGYLADIKQKFDNLTKSIERETGQISNQSLYDYFCVFFAIPIFIEDQIIVLLSTQGAENAEQLISEYYDEQEFTNENLRLYSSAQKAIAKSMLDAMKNAMEYGCMQGGVLQETCMQEHLTDIYTYDISMTMGENELIANEASTDLQNSALTELADLYYELYAINESVQEGENR